MKNLRKASVMLLMISVVAFVLFKIYIHMVQDNIPPVVSCETDILELAVDAPEEDLFKGVSAQDSRSGDVSSTLVVESMSDFLEDGTRIITYAAVDESKNVGRCERTLKYIGYEKPKFDLNGPLSFVAGDSVNISGTITAASVLDGDISDKIKYTLEESIDSMEEGNYPIEFRVMDSGGKNVYLKTTVEIVGREYSGIHVYLKDYLIYLKKGSDFNPDTYFHGTDYGEVEVSVRSKVDTDKTGVYFVDYIASSYNLKGKSRLLVVVQ